MRESEQAYIEALIRAAPIEPDQWAPALDAIARVCGGSSAQLLSFGDSRFRPVTAPGFSSDDISAFVALGGTDPSVNLGLGAVMSSRLHDILTDEEYLPEGRRSRDPLYNDFFNRFDGDYVASGTVACNAAAVCNLNLFFARASGGMSPEGRRALERLLPRLTEAVRMTAWLETRALTLSMDVWAARGEAVMVCDAERRMRFATAAAERLLRRGDAVVALHSRLSCTERSTADALALALRAAPAPLSPQAGRLVAHSGDERLLLEILPLPTASGIEAPLALVTASVVDLRPRLDGDLLQDAFGLTPAEAAVADGLMRRLTSVRIAAVRGVSAATINSQVRAILAKTRAPSRAALTLILQGFVRRPTS